MEFEEAFLADNHRVGISLEEQRLEKHLLPLNLDADKMSVQLSQI